MDIRECLVRFKDEGKQYKRNIAVGYGIYSRDQMVFFVAKDEKEFEKLFSEDNGEDFVIITDYSDYEIPFMSICRDDLFELLGREPLPSETRKIADAMSSIYMESFSETLRDAIFDCKILCRI